MTFFGKMDVQNKGERELVIRRSFNAPRQLVWRAHTEPELVKRWLAGPPGWMMSRCDIDLRVDGPYRYEWKHENGCEMGMGGIHKLVDAPAKLVTTQLFDEDWTGGEALGTVELAEEDGVTHITNTILYTSPQAREMVLASGATAGMEMGYQKLEDLLPQIGA